MGQDTVKGSLNDDVMLKNRFRVTVVGLIPFYAIEVDGLSSEIGTVELPDATTTSTGILKSGELTIKTPTHHKFEQAALHGWYLMNQDPVVVTSKLIMTIELLTQSGNTFKAWEVVGCYPFKFELDGLQKNGAESELHTTTWSFKCDSLIPLP